MKEAQILFVVETNPYTQSDNAYYSWILKNYFGSYFSPNGQNGIRFLYEYIYMDGKTNYRSSPVRREISTRKGMFVRTGRTHVAYCFDVDNNTLPNRDFLFNAEAYCAENGYSLSLAHPEIERVMRIDKGKTKIEKVMLFRKANPKKNEFDRKAFFTPKEEVLSHVGTTNYGLVVQNVIESEEK